MLRLFVTILIRKNYFRSNKLSLNQHMYGRDVLSFTVLMVTKHDNTTARTLYDRFAPTDGFVRYTIKV